MKKALILFSEIYKIGGIQQYSRCLIKAFESEFPEVQFMALSFDGEQEDRNKNKHGKKILFYDYRGPKIFKKIIYLFNVLKISILNKPELIVCTHINIAPVALLIKKIFSIKYVILTHGIDCWNIKKGIKYNSLKNAATIITVSGYSKNIMIKNGLPENKIKVLRNAIELSNFYPKKDINNIRERLLPNDKIALLTIGRMIKTEKYKGHDIILEVLKELGDKYTWVVVGDGDDKERLKQKAEKLKIIKQVKFVGNVPNDALLDYYNIADIFIMPSKGEGFGVVFLEAMACGKPVIGGSGDGSREPLMEGKTGFLVNPDNKEEIIKAIKTIEQKKDIRTNADYLVKSVRDNFTIDIFCKKAKDIFKEFLCEKQ